ncbi:tumor necrosis factor receptor superfamily member 1A [Mixophyes fleayi]|uniref:tumor necrosis factor receptor superfamily member 1A n=1 Tax=Mixophyes fleayi TaxID=3061075 RepID=UPI003F4D75BC
MTGLFLLISFIWVFPSICQDINIPLQSALLVKSEPVGFSLPPRRHKRAERGNGTISCNDSEYKPRKVDYCCNKCLAGFKVKTDCRGRGQKTDCVPCDPDSYTDKPSHSKYCESCSNCLLQNGQIELLACTGKRDVLCGCPDGQFKTAKDKNFACQNCSKCVNGTELVKCNDDNDTICKCFHTFFFDEEARKCRPCKECQSTDCQDHCPRVVESFRPKENEKVPLVIMIGIISLAVVLVAAVAYIVWMQRKKITSYLQNKTCSQTNVIEGTIAQTTCLMEDGSEVAYAHQPLPGYTPCAVDNPNVVQQIMLQSATTLPDVTLQTSALRLQSPEILYTIIECIPIGRWKEFVRRLGLNNYIIETSEQDNKHYKDAQYAMLSVWINRTGSSGAKRDLLFEVLRDMDLGGCVERIEECL